MKRVWAICVVTLVALIAARAASPPPPNFAGVWVLNRSKSAGLTGALANAEIRLIVTQDDKQITTEQKVIIKGREQPSQEFFYKLDGSETTAEVVRPMAGTMKLKAKWIEYSRTLELTLTITGDDAGKTTTVTTREQWQLREDGKVLQIVRSRETPQGKKMFGLHFDKQE